jgi:Bacteriophage tail assembly protein
LLVPAWAERNIVLSEKETDYPGSYRTAVAPYCRGPMDAFTDRSVKTLVFVTCAQAGKTVNVIAIPLAYTIAQDPGPALLVLPTEPIARSFSESRLQPVFDNSPTVSALKPNDSDKYKLLEMHFARSDLFLVGSNSPANLAQRPIRYLFADEIDKFPPASLREADALALAMERVKAKWKSKAVLTSTPSTPEGNIWKYWTRSDRRH